MGLETNKFDESAEDIMAGSVNKVILVGNLGRDPDSRSFSNGGKVVNLSVATSERWRDKATGENRERTEWHRVAIFNDRLGDIAERYLKKGSTVYLEGQLETRKWQDPQTGQDRYSTEIVLRQFRGELTLLGGRGDGGGGPMGESSGGFAPAHEGAGGFGNPNNGGSFGQNNQGSGGGAPLELDDDIPF